MFNCGSLRTGGVLPVGPIEKDKIKKLLSCKDTIV